MSRKKARPKRERIRIACDIEPTLDPRKTGIGWLSYELICALARRKDVEMFLECCAPDAETRDRAHAVFPAMDRDHFRFGRTLRASMYHNLWPILPLPYRFVVPTDKSAHLFTNYHVPPGVPGPRITIISDMVVQRFPESMNWKTKLMLDLTLKKSVRRATHIFTISRFSKSEIMELLAVPEERITVIPLGIDHTKFHNRYQTAEIAAARAKYGLSAPYFLFVGTIEPRKNLVKLINAYHRAYQGDPQLPKLVLTGRKGWLYSDVFESIEKNRLQDQVIFTDYVADADIPLLMCGARAFLFPSQYEGFGLPPLEAMACGAPVLVSNRASLPEVVGEAGLQIDPDDASALVHALKRLAYDDALCDRLRKAGLDRARLFTWDRAAEVAAAAIQTVSRGAARGAGRLEGAARTFP